MIIKDKWKSFAVRYIFSNDLTKEEAVGIYDALTSFETSEKVDSFIEDKGLLQWVQFEYNSGTALVLHVESLAVFAQGTEEGV